MTDEHISALSCVGEKKIEKGSCKSCNNDANQRYEWTALSTDFNHGTNIIGAKAASTGTKVKTSSCLPWRRATMLCAEATLTSISCPRNIPIALI
jgi:hypothetical protein